MKKKQHGFDHDVDRCNHPLQYNNMFYQFYSLNFYYQKQDQITRKSEEENSNLFACYLR